MTLKEFARLAAAPARDIKRYRDAGLLDPERDGYFDDYDALRLRYVRASLAAGRTLADLSEVAAGDRPGFPGSELLFPSRPRYALKEAGEQVGLTPEQIEALRTATGLPGSAVGEGDLEALRAVKVILESGMPWDSVLEAARVFGDSLRRTAETEVRLHQARQQSGDGAGPPTELIETLLPVIDPLLSFLHRQHLIRAAVAAAVSDLEGEGETRTLRVAVVFVDLASFTALADVHGDEAAAVILDRLDVLIRTLSIEHKGVLAKQIGDAFMLVFGEPGDAIGFALALDHAAAGEARFPSMRTGIHAGPVLYRVGDYVGTTVNVASRLASVAEPSQILMTAPVASAATGFGIEVEPVGVRTIRGIAEPVTLYRAVKPDDRPGERDPVCGMVVVGEPAGRLSREGAEFFFCSERCLSRFLESPERYVSQARV